MGEVVNLMDRASVMCAEEGETSLVRWHQLWAEHIAEGKQGEITSIVMFAERKDGSIFKLSQSVSHMDRRSVVGFVHLGLIELLSGRADPYMSESEKP